MKENLNRLALLLTCLSLLSAPSFAASAESDKAKVVLTVQGATGVGNMRPELKFDMAMLEALPQVTFSTMTPWNKSPIKFTGPLLRDVLGAAKVNGKTINASALNDYNTAIPVEDAYKFDVIVAHHMDGALIPVRTKGPLFIVYPYDAKAELRSSMYYERSAWQLKSLSVE
jgi:hypothetical protein